MSLALQRVYGRVTAELHLYVRVYLLINDLVIDGLHGMFYEGCCGKCEFVAALAV